MIRQPGPKEGVPEMTKLGLQKEGHPPSTDPSRLSLICIRKLGRCVSNLLPELCPRGREPTSQRPGVQNIVRGMGALSLNEVKRFLLQLYSVAVSYVPASLTVCFLAEASQTFMVPLSWPLSPPAASLV